MQKEKEQQKPREELTLVFFPSSSLMLHSEGGREGGCKTEKREKKNGRRGWREEGSHPPPFTSCSSGSHLVWRFLCTQCLVFSSLSPLSPSLTHPSSPLFSSPSLFLRLRITYIPPMFHLYMLFPFLPLWLSPPLPPPSHDRASSIFLSTFCLFIILILLFFPVKDFHPASLPFLLIQPVVFCLSPFIMSSL